MQLQINGQATQINATTLDELISELELPRESLVVEHNSQIVRQQQWAQTRLSQDDVLELLSFVGGG
ncbi:sulfur carrier protein ThiS [Desulfogranum mediterraneum]|uniref:sulfur carrier protein ThiS n=1 Tax=Desulfogranum mediterraneum TaxID=160661 RepID=UPI000413B811|nr:sulfur carrier protein ThiS [Desulfogranum mediterraneum]